MSGSVGNIPKDLHEVSYRRIEQAGTRHRAASSCRGDPQERNRRQEEKAGGTPGVHMEMDAERKRKRLEQAKTRADSKKVNKREQRKANTQTNRESCVLKQLVRKVRPPKKNWGTDKQCHVCSDL